MSTNSKSFLFEADFPSKFLLEESETKKVAVRSSKIHQQHEKKHSKQLGHGNHKVRTKPVLRSLTGNHQAKANRSPEDIEHERSYKASLKPVKDSHEEHENDF